MVRALIRAAFPRADVRRGCLARADGQAAIEWLGALAVVTAVITVLLGIGLGGPIGTGAKRAVESVFTDVGGGHGPGSPTIRTDMIPRPDPGGPLRWSDLPRGPRVKGLTRRNEMRPWSRIGMTQDQWDRLQSAILSRVNPHGVLEILFGDKYAGINLDKHGHIVLVPISQDGIGEGLGDLLEDLTGAGKALAASAAQALGDAIGSLSEPVLAKLAQYGLLSAGEEASKDFATETGQAFFWSGSTDGIGGPEIAARLAAGRGGTTLEKLAADRGIRLPEYDPANAESVTAWEEASELYARGAKGTVYAVVGKTVRSGSVWSRIEMPALEANPKVTKIISIDPATHVETTIYRR